MKLAVSAVGNDPHARPVQPADVVSTVLIPEKRLSASADRVHSPERDCSHSIQVPAGPLKQTVTSQIVYIELPGFKEVVSRSEERRVGKELAIRMQAPA